MTSTQAIDFNQPESAKAIGGELATTAQALASRLAGTAVTDLASLDQAVRHRQQLGEAAKRVSEFFAPFKGMAHKLHKALCDRENEILGPVLQRDREIARAIGDYKDACDRARAAREREEAERQRIEQQTRAAVEAAALENAGEREMAAAVVEEAIAAPPPVVALRDETKDISGLKFTTRWKWRYSGGPAEVKATPPQLVARTMAMIPREFLCVDEQKVGAYVRSMKGSARIPGIDVYSVQDPVR
jgi:hypothetical protein